MSDVPGDDSVRMEAGQAEGGVDVPAPASKPYASSRNEMKKRIIDKKLDPLTVIASIAADLDAASDWAFFYDLGHRSGGAAYPHVMRMYKAALAFTVVGTLIWLLVWSEFHPVASALERITRTMMTRSRARTDVGRVDPLLEGFACLTLRETVKRAQLNRAHRLKTLYQLGCCGKRGLEFAEPHPLTCPFGTRHILLWQRADIVRDIVTNATAEGPVVIWAKLDFKSDFAFRASGTVIFDTSTALSVRLPRDVIAPRIEITQDLADFIDLTFLPDVIDISQSPAHIEVSAERMSADWGAVLDAIERKLQGERVAHSTMFLLAVESDEQCMFELKAAVTLRDFVMDPAIHAHIKVVPAGEMCIKAVHLRNRFQVFAFRG
ncbi:hypothetical protein JKP88DRAFT_272832 [Tribonema minus]|uniref:Uncharacterized protein n=1 Tax=Tribonema minus TaxID=303371 RepID=A0A836CEJ4_9STRA|nr:hypothetical protein JKP88DRAFT_272832 [Tribonema minus]